MDRITRVPFAGLVAMTVLSWIAPALAGGFDVPYCSSQNTADTSAQYWQYQSNGKCTDICNSMGSYAFGIVQDSNCWCSNYIPEDQQDTSECSEGCPGINTESCGNKDKGLFGYIKLQGNPSGTMGTSKPTSANVSPSATPLPSSTKPAPSSEAMTPPSAPPSPSSSAVETRPDPATVIQTVTAPPQVVTYTPTSVSTPVPTPSDKPSSSAAAPPPPSSTTLQTSTTTSNDEPTTTIPPQTSIQVVTESGQVKTQTVIFTPSSAPVQTPSQKSSSNTGAIVGGVVGGIAGVAAIVGGMFFLLRRRQQRRFDDDEPSGVQRNTSTMSKAGLLRRGTEKGPQYPPPIATSFARRQSRTLDQESISPISGSGGLDRRNSRLQVDQRLNPSAIFVFDNSSRGSFGSMDDSRDYHRSLNIRNPDPQ